MAVGSWAKGFIEDSYGWMWESYGKIKGKVDEIYDVRTDADGMYDQITTGIAMGRLQQMSSYDSSPTFRRPSEGFTAYCAFRQFKDGFELGELEVERFPSSKVRNLAKDAISSWGEGLRQTEETFGASLFKNGGKTAGHDDFTAVVPNLISQQTGGLAYDSKPFFNLSNNTRTSKGGGTYYNAKSTTLNQANYAELHDLVYITNAKNERDEEVDLKAMGRTVLLIPEQLRDEAFQAVKDEVVVGATNGQKNPRKGTADIIEWRYISGTSSPDMSNTWFVGTAKRGIRFYRAMKPKITPSRDPRTGSYLCTVSVLMGWIGENFRFWGGSNVPTS